MDAIKHFTEGMIKENKPQFEVGDTVRVSVRIKEGVVSVARSRMLMRKVSRWLALRPPQLT